MARVAIDARVIGPKAHGFGRYISLIAAGLQVLEKKRPLQYEPVFLVAPQFEQFLAAGYFSNFKKVPVHAPFLSVQGWSEIPRLLKREHIALYHSPTFESLPYSPCPWIQTVHDLNHLQFGSFAQKIYYRFLLQRSARRAKRLLTVSEFSRSEISEWLRIDPSSIEVVLNALDPQFVDVLVSSAQETQQVLDQMGVSDQKYFLCISNAKPHKNVESLLRAYRNYRKTIQNPWPLVLNFSQCLLQVHEGEGVICRDDLTDQHVRILIERSGSVLFPSLYEGFGLPPLEAVVLGAPVVVSKIPPHLESLRDLSADEMTWVEPRDVAGWSESMRRATSRAEPIRASDAARARLREQYSCERLGLHMDQIYRDVLGLRP